MNNSKLELTTFGGGCFWCIETLFKRLKGVEKVESGYSGGHKTNPTYYEVVDGNTGHAEVIQITFDPTIISFFTLLEIFFEMHDPTTLNSQGNDKGPQYRSIILYHNELQKNQAQEYINKLDTSKKFSTKIVTELKQYEAFYKAEEYHQNYYENNPNQPYCDLLISPKVQKFKEKYKQLLKED